MPAIPCIVDAQLNIFLLCLYLGSVIIAKTNNLKKIAIMHELDYIEF
jgi:hypothetical protein